MVIRLALLSLFVCCAGPPQCQFNWKIVTWNFHLWPHGLVGMSTLLSNDEGSAVEHGKALLTGAEIN